MLVFVVVMVVVITAVILVTYRWLNGLERRFEQEDKERTEWYDH